jgi:amino acid adenylation domain-containing protein
MFSPVRGGQAGAGLVGDGVQALGAEDRHRVLVLWNLTEAPYPRHRCLQQVLLEAMTRDPDAAAVRCGDESLTRRELGRRALQLARLLRGLGAGPRRPVAVLVEDPLLAIVSVLGASFAGAAVLALDPTWPAEALSRAMSVMGPRVLVGDRAARAAAAAPAMALWVDGVTFGPDDGAPLLGLDTGVGPTDAAWIALAPGATGAVVVSHRGAISQLHARLAAHGAPARALALASPVSSTGLGALVWALAAGGALVLPTRTEADTPGALRALVAGARVTHLVGPARRYEQLLVSSADLASLRTVVVDGATPALAARHVALAPGARLWNGLELTEAGGLVTTFEVPASPDEVPDPLPLGRPLHNVRCYVLDARREPVPPGVVGDLWLGGDAVTAPWRTFTPALLPDSRHEVDPFRRDDPDARIARTPLRARWRDDGLLELASTAPGSAGRAGLDAGAASAGPRQGKAPLAPTQEVFWLHERLEPGSTAYSVVARARLRGPLDTTALTAALAALVRRHEALRVRLLEGPAGEPEQEAVDDARLALRTEDLTHERDPAAAARARVLVASRAPFALDRAPLARALLVRTGALDHELTLVLHHAVSDGTSIGVLLDDLATLYVAARADASDEGDLDAALPPARSWLEAARSLRARLRAREDDLRGRWRDRLAGAARPLAIPGDRPRADRPAGARECGRLVRDLDEGLVARVRALARAHGATPAAIALAALELVLHRWTGEDDLVLGAAVSLRDRADVARTAGCLVGSALVRVQVTPDQPFADLLARTRDALLDAMSGALLPITALVADPRLRLGGGGPAFNVLFNALPPRPALANWGDVEADLLDAEDPTTAFDATVYVQERGARLRVEVVHDAWLLEPGRASALAAQLEAVIAQAVDDPACAVAAFDLVTPDARAVLPDAGADLAPGGPGDTIHGPVERQAARAPGRIAVADATSAWTYEHLAARARQVARGLASAGVAPGDRVAVWAHRSAPLAAALLGVLRAGAAFAILDPEHPPARLALQLEALAPRALVLLAAAGPLPDAVHAAAGDAARLVVEAGASLDAVEAPGSGVVDPEAIAYVAFTSGTTGAPRGVLGAHAPVARFLAWQRARYGLGPDDRVAVLSGLGHDPLLRDLFAPLSAGASARLPEAGVRRDPARLLAWLRAERVTVAHVTPGLLAVLAAASGAARALPDLRLVFSGGERLTRGDVARLRVIAPGARVVGLYGTTETPQGVGFFEPDDGDAAAGCPSATVPAGRGVDGVQLLVLGPRGRPAGVGELGEVHVRTPHLTRGYLTEDDPAARGRFLPGPQGLGAWDRMFRTGDLGRHGVDGVVELVGRADRQVKVRGHRVELGEVEATLARWPGVERAIAALRDGPDGPRLLAWVRPTTGPECGALDGAALRAALAAALPEAAVPAAVVVLDTDVPLTPNGKVDVARLPAPDARAQEGARKEVSPRTQLEEQIAGLWAQLLQLERVSVHDDFFALGGHSLLAVRMLGLLGERLGVVVPVSLLQRAPTVAGLAQALHQGNACPEEPLAVEIQAGAGLAPLWLLHPVGGHVVFARRLAARLDPARPVIGIQAQGLDGRREPLRTVDDMAALYLTLIRARQPQGPYHLAGPSFGGLLAWELARRLAAEGAHVGVVGLLDTFGPGFPRWKPLPLRLVDHARAFAHLPGWSARRAYLRARLETLRLRVTGAAPPAKKLQLRQVLARDGTAEGALNDLVRRVFVANYEASNAYEPGPYDGRALVITAARRPEVPGLCWDDPSNGWAALARGGTDVRPVDATHQKLVDPPAVDEVAAHLDAALRAAEGR